MAALNPNAEPFVPQNADRSLFMTFSNGSPLTQQEIATYFNSVGFGDCVEFVFIHTRRGREPMSGNITFRTSELPRALLVNQEVVKILVNGKPVWLKKYIPRTQRLNMNA